MKNGLPKKKTFRIKTVLDGGPAAVELQALSENHAKQMFLSALGILAQILSVEEVGPADQGGTET